MTTTKFNKSHYANGNPTEEVSDNDSRNASLHSRIFFQPSMVFLVECV